MVIDHAEVIKVLTRKADLLEEKLNDLNQQRTELVNNPAADTGGIRSESAKRRQQRHNRYDQLVREGTGLRRQIDELRNKAVKLPIHIKVMEAAEAVLAAGALKGELLSNEDRKEIESIRKKHKRAIDRIIIQAMDLKQVEVPE